MSSSLVSAEIIQQILQSIDPEATVTDAAKDVLAGLFNYHVDTTLKSAHQSASNRTPCNIADELRNAKNALVLESVANPPNAAAIEILSPTDAAVQLEVQDIMKKLKLPQDCQISLTTPEETNLFGPIKCFSSPSCPANASSAPASDQTAKSEFQQFMM